MPNWKRTVDIVEAMDKTRDETITVQELSAIVVTKLKELEPFTESNINDELADLIDEFESLAGDEDTDSDAFDDVYDRLCDWGDTKLDNKWNGDKVCWIKTF